MSTFSLGGFISFIFAHNLLFSVINWPHIHYWNMHDDILKYFYWTYGLFIWKPVTSVWELRYCNVAFEKEAKGILSILLFKVAKHGHGHDANSVNLWLILGHVSGIISQIKLHYTLDFSDSDLIMDFRFDRQNFWSICHVSVTCENTLLILKCF